MTQTWLFLDFDNTLMATEQYALPSLIARFNDLYGAQTPAPLTLEGFKKHFHGQSREHLCDSMSKHFGITVDYPVFYDAREWRVVQHLKQVTGGIPMAENLLDALQELQQRNIQFALVTNNPLQRAIASMRLAGNKMGRELMGLLGCNLFEAGDIQKPKPDVYLRAMEMLDTSPDHCFAVEDSVTGVTASVAAHIKTFGYTGFADDADVMAEKLMQAGCIACFNDWRDFPALFSRFL